LSYEHFRQAVLDRQIARARAKGKSFFPPLADDELEFVEENFRMRSAPAQDCRALLAAARSALGQARVHDERARQTRSIGICSAYRDYNYDAGLWRGTFDKHYHKMLAAGRFAGREHGPHALQYMLQTMLPLKAAPGFSNHSDGRAVDFKTVHAGEKYGANSSQREGWRATWLHPWLVQNAREFGFAPLASEEWHWDHS
ncbi:MAG: hypothetical protein JWN04_849, partial [Myxococcaceae bacterium]|nr:hypothetical protein [Myxococcaceae bacterium]